jgi:hypothetical protein
MHIHLFQITQHFALTTFDRIIEFSSKSITTGKKTRKGCLGSSRASICFRDLDSWIITINQQAHLENKLHRLARAACRLVRLAQGKTRAWSLKRDTNHIVSCLITNQIQQMIVSNPIARRSTKLSPYSTDQTTNRNCFKNMEPLIENNQ